MAVLLTDLGILVTVIGFISILKPPAFLGIRSRGLALAVFVGGLLLSLVAVLWPTQLKTWSGTKTRIDDILPSYHFNEVHTTEIAASPARVFQAIKEVTPREIVLLRELMIVQSSGQTNLPLDKPFLQIFQEGGYAALEQDLNHEFVAGGLLNMIGGAKQTISDAESYRAFNERGYAKVVLNFLIEDAGNNKVKLTTQTRVLGTDAVAKRNFGIYWRIIYPGSALIRITLLQAIKARAERLEGTL